MKKIVLVGAVIYGFGAQIGCGSTDNSSSPAPTAAASCSMSATGTYVNSSNGAACNCIYSNGTYIDSISGASCTGVGGTTAGYPYGTPYGTPIGTTVGAPIGPIGTPIGTPVVGTNSCVQTSPGFYVNPVTNIPCSTATTTSCVLSNGTFINTATGYPCSTLGIPSGYTYDNGCSYWNMVYAPYGAYYEPAYMNGQAVCVEVN